MKEPACQVREKALLLHRNSYWKTLRVNARVLRFVSHSLSKVRGLKKKGPITTDEIEMARNCLIRRVQRDVSEQTKAPGWQLVKVEDNGIFLCKKRISGYQPIYVHASPFVEKLIEYTHEKIMHLGVANTMAAIRKQYWVPYLRSKVKKAIKRCHT